LTMRPAVARHSAKVGHRSPEKCSNRKCRRRARTKEPRPCSCRLGTNS
jgi:hypothetical protein